MALRANSLTFISLCSGGGGLDLGVELAIPDARPVVLVEGEAWSVATLVSAMEARLMAPAPVWSDVRTFDGLPWRGLVDGLIGGIPCQPHSLAGKRKGSDDERDLWSPARRIIVQARPWFVLIENVRGMLSAPAGQVPGAKRVWRDLQRLGYEVELGIFTAEEVGPPHQRERVFILAVAEGHSGRTELETERTQCRRSVPSGDGGAYQHGFLGGCSNAGAGAITDGQVNTFRTVCDITKLEHAVSRRHPGHPQDALEGSLGRIASQRSGGGGVEHLADADIALLRREPSAGQQQELQRDDASRRAAFPLLYPPRPSDLDRWRGVLAHSPELEPAVRRMADGMAARLDLAGPHAARIERLRMLGNGVVPLEAAYALRVLATRLARRSAGADTLVRMMVQP